jgi:hypothetical protein
MWLHWPFNGDDSSWQVGFAVPDLFIEGSQFGVYYADLLTKFGSALVVKTPLT